MRKLASYLLLVFLLFLGVAVGAQAQTIQWGRDVSGIQSGTDVHTNGLAQMPSYNPGQGVWDITYIPVLVPGTGEQRLAAIQGVGGFAIEDDSPPSLFFLSAFSSQSAILANPLVGDLFNSTISPTSVPVMWGHNAGNFNYPRQSWDISYFPTNGTDFTALAGSTIYLSVVSNQIPSSAWTWAETNVSSQFGADPVLLWNDPSQLIYLNNPPYSYAYGVAGVDVGFVSVDAEAGNATPEPSSCGVLTAGLIAFALVFQRRRTFTQQGVAACSVDSRLW